MMEHLSWVYRAWRYRLRLEKPEIRCMLQRLSPGDAVIDIGAHKGAYTYWMIRAVGATGAVFAFEPQQQLAQRLRALVSAAGHTNVSVENLGISSRPGTLTLNLPHFEGPPGASFETRSFSQTGSHQVPVEVTTLDDYFMERSGPVNRRIRLLKCDAEGHELEVFRGGRLLLEDQGPDLLFECESRHRESPVEEVFEFLQSLGYEGWYFDRFELEPLEQFDVRVHQANPEGKNYANNFLFTRGQSRR
jgi:FkbM family methyltransferase